MTTGFAILFALAAAGELAARTLGLPVGGAVIGLVALIAWLAPRNEVPPALSRAADALLAELGLLFVPAGAGVLAHWPILQEHGLALLVALCGGTLAGLVAAACTFVAIRRALSARPVATPCEEPAR
jgi:putative effector of murein hydrolase LrgA (UPF0299 family)